MTGVDIVITGGKVVTPDGTFEASIAIAGESIVAIGPRDALPQARETIDASGKYVIPGAIDSHVHFRAPGYDYKEDWQTGTGGAARGGVTTVFEMPNTKPPTGTVEALRQKQAIAKAQAYVDYGIYGLLDENNIGELEALMDAGVSSFKCSWATPSATSRRRPTARCSRASRSLARRGYRCTVHAENASIMARRQAQLRPPGAPIRWPTSPRVPRCAQWRPSGAIIFAEWTGARLHIAHKSSKDALYLIRDAKRRGVDVTVETCPQYLLLSTEDMAVQGGVMRVNPPIREPGHRSRCGRRCGKASWT